MTNTELYAQINASNDIKLLTLFMEYYHRIQAGEIELTTEEIIWNLITDYEDAWNCEEPEPYTESNYQTLCLIVEPEKKFPFTRNK
jgi:hypothetical protein